MDEEKTKKPLLSYEQVIDMIKKRVARDEEDNLGEEDNCDERIVRIEKAAKKLEIKYRRRSIKKKICFLNSLWKKIFRCR